MARSEENELLSRRIAVMNFGLYASEAYLDEHGEPQSDEDLRNHVLIDWLDAYPRAAPAVWFRQITRTNPAFLKVNSVNDRVVAASNDIGITPLPFLIARDTSLKRVLPNLEIPPLEMWLLAHPEAARIARVRALMDFIAHAAQTQAKRFTDAT